MIGTALVGVIQLNVILLIGDLLRVLYWVLLYWVMLCWVSYADIMLSGTVPSVFMLIVVAPFSETEVVK
jgi:hypothetical protein